jgi:uncharacterized protein YcfJ
MNRSMLIGALFGAAVATAGGGLAGYQMLKEDSGVPATAAQDERGASQIDATDITTAEAPTGGDEVALLVDAEQESAPASVASRSRRFAEVLSVEPITERVDTPREECRDQPVTRQKPVKDRHQIAGTVVGAVAGGLIGDKLGGGGKNTGEKVIGAAAGGYAGNKVQEKIQRGATYQTTERVCRTVYDTREKTIGYDVAYELDGERGTVRMDHDPGDAIPVRDGELVLSRG